MVDNPLSVNTDEGELFEYMQLAHDEAFSTTVSHNEGLWTVKVVDIKGGSYTQSHGDTFAAAWRARRYPANMRLLMKHEKAELQKGLWVIEGGKG